MNSSRIRWERALMIHTSKLLWMNLLCGSQTPWMNLWRLLSGLNWLLAQQGPNSGCILSLKFKVTLLKLWWLGWEVLCSDSVPIQGTECARLCCSCWQPLDPVGTAPTTPKNPLAQDCGCILQVHCHGLSYPLDECHNTYNYRLHYRIHPPNCVSNRHYKTTSLLSHHTQTRRIDFRLLVIISNITH